MELKQASHKESWLRESYYYNHYYHHYYYGSRDEAPYTELEQGIEASDELEVLTGDYFKFMESEVCYSGCFANLDVDGIKVEVCHSACHSACVSGGAS